MKKTLGIVAVIFVITLNLHAQNTEIIQGKVFTPEKNTFFNYYIGNDETGIYIRRTRTRGKGTSYFFQKIDNKTFAAAYTKDLNMDPNESPNTCLLKNGNILMFSDKYDGKDKMLLLREYKAVDGSPIGDIKRVASLPSDPFGVNGRNFYVSFSPDNTKIMIVSEFQWPKKTPEVFADVYEYPSYKKLFTKKILDSYGQSTISSSNYNVDNTGKIFYLFNYMVDFDEKISGMALATIAPGEQNNEVIKLPLNKMEIQNGTFRFVNDQLILAGIFKDIVTKKEKKSGVKKKVGVYSFFINPKTGNITNKGYDYFTKEIVDKLSYGKGLIETDPADKYYSYEELITFNGNTYLIESHSYTISGNGGSMTFERELIVSKFNNAGKLQWMKIIPKFTGGSLNSFNYLVNNNKIYLVYCEHPKNLKKYTVTDYDPKSYAPMKYYNGSISVCTSIDENGNLNRSELFMNKGWCYDANSTNITIKPDNDLVLRMINGEKERFDILRIK